MEYALNYKDIYLVPNYSEVTTRKDVDISLKWGDWYFRNCVVPANMPPVINQNLAKWCSFDGIPYFYHRFEDTFEFVKKANEEKWPCISISVGVNKKDKDLLNKIYDNNLKVDIILIDTAHGFSQLTRDMISFVKNFKVFIVAGNVCGGQESIESLENWGANAIKVGLSHGAGCSTYNQTGFGSPMFSAAIEAGKWASVPLIIDGGCRTNGDITKAIVAVLQHSYQIPLIMVGNLLAACKDAPGENIYKHQIDYYQPISSYDGPFIPRFKEIWYKKYYGSASKVNKEKSGQEVRNVEGFEIEIPCNNMTYEEKYQEIKESISSSLSYAGGRTLDCLKNTKWVVVK